MSTPARDALDDKVNQVFAGKCVRKDLVRAVKVGANVPVFVLEYLLGKYCASSDPAAIELGMAVVRDTLANNYIRPDEATKAQSKVKQKGRYTFIDKVKVRLVGNTYVAGGLSRSASATTTWWSWVLEAPARALQFRSSPPTPPCSPAPPPWPTCLAT